MLFAACAVPAGGCAAPAAGSGASASRGEAEIRARLQGWLEANRRRDRAGMQAIWDPKSVCWLPEAPELSNAAAARLAGSDPALRGWSAYDLSTDRIDVMGDLGVVHNIFTETRHFTDTAKTVSRRLRGSELWQRQADGQWRIIRCVSAPDPWRLD
jgi:ketosteroid isomerase-like protein